MSHSNMQSTKTLSLVGGVFGGEVAWAMSRQGITKIQRSTRDNDKKHPLGRKLKTWSLDTGWFEAVDGKSRGGKLEIGQPDSRTAGHWVLDRYI